MAGNFARLIVIPLWASVAVPPVAHHTGMWTEPPVFTPVCGNVLNFDTEELDPTRSISCDAPAPPWHAGRTLWMVPPASI